MNLRSFTKFALASAALGGVFTSARADILLGQERIAGRDSRGPYTLSRQAVEDRSEQVWVNGARMISGRDYQFDATMGALSFADSVPQSASIEVDYQYDTTKAHAPTALGGSLGLLSGGSGGLSINYAFKPTGNGNQTLSGLGFSGQGSLLGSSLTSSFMVDKTASANAGMDAQSMQLSMKKDSGPFTYSLDYSNVGKSFSQADALKLVKGSQALNFSGSLQLAQNGALTLKDVNTSTPDAKTGVVKDTSIQSGNVALNLSDATKLTALHQTETDTQAGTTKDTAVDRLQLDQNLSKTASLSLINETQTSGTNGQDTTTKATRMNLVASGDHGLKLDTTLALTDSSASGAAREAGVKLAQTDGSTNLSLSLSDRKADAGDQQTESLSLQSGATDRLKVAMNLSNDTGATKNGVASSLSMSSALTSGLKFSASRADDKTAPNGGTSSTKVNLDSQTGTVKVAMSYAGNDDGTTLNSTSGVNIEAAPSSELKVTANVGQKTDSNGLVQSKGVTMQATPNKTLSLAASHTDSSAAAGLSGTNSVSLTAGGPAMKLTGSYSDQLNQDKTQVQIAMLQADIQPATRLAVSGLYKQRDLADASQVNTMNASVTLKPAKALQMVGTYSSNPEEQNQVLRLVRKGLSLQTTMGGLSLSGGYTQENSLLDTSQGTRAEFKMGLQCGKNAKLEGGFTQTVGAVRGYTPQLSYNMKYNHQIGSDFNMSLDANVVKNDDTVPEPQREDVKATANLALRF